MLLRTFAYRWCACHRAAVFLLLFLLLAPPLLSQQAEEATEQKGTGTEDPPEEITRSEALKNTLAQDISTSSYYSLKAWLKSLDLPLDGDSEKLRQRLYQHYGFQAPPQSSASKLDKLLITITGANQTRFFELKRDDGTSESYIQITGGVEVNLNDSKTGEKHSIKADAITFNKETSTISATGNIIYERTNKDKKTEYSFGQSLTFKVKGWRGLIVQGAVVRGQKLSVTRPSDVVPIKREHLKEELIEKVEVKKAAEDKLAKATKDKDIFFLGKTTDTRERLFYLSGETLRKGDGEVMILEEGRVTTEDVANPTFSLRASRIWLLSGDEWAMLNAPLFVGHIPVFYLPFYYYTSNAPFFNPVFGFGEPYGDFIQTTTYLLGRKKDETEDAFSFLPVMNPLKNYDLELMGLFLVRQPGQGSGGKSDYLKLALDYYSRIGPYAALDGDFKFSGWLSSIKFFAGFSLYRAIDNNGNTVFLNKDKTSYQFYPVETAILGTKVPFRYGSSANLVGKYLSVDFQFYSDPQFNKDYSGRKETFDWVIYGFGKLNPITFEEFRQQLKGAVITTQTWNLSSKISERIDFLDPYISTINFNNFVRFDFAARTDANVPEYDRSREFFAPKTVVLPETNLSFEGTVFSTRARDRKSLARKDGVREDERIFPLWSESADSAKPKDEAAKAPVDKAEPASEVPAKPLFDPPLLLPFAGQNVAVTTVDSSLKYSFSSNNSLTSSAVDEGWKTLSHVDNRFYSTFLSTDNTLALKYDLGFFDRFIDFKIDNTSKANERQYFPFWKNAAKPDERKILNDTKQILLENSNQFSLALSPFKLVPVLAPVLSGSKVSYLLNHQIYQRKFDNNKNGFETYWIDLLNRNRVSKHDLSAVLDFHPINASGLSLSDLQLKLSAALILPPLYRKETITPYFTITFFNWTHSLTLIVEKQYNDPAVKEEDKVWRVKPLSYITSFKAFEDKLSFNNTFVLDFQKKVPQKNNFSFSAWWFSGTFNANYEAKQSWDKSALKWDPGEEKFQAKEVSLKFSLKTDQIYFWKNRISLIVDYSLEWSQDLIRYNNKSSLANAIGFALYIYDFLDLQFKVTSRNDYLYLYYPGAREMYGFATDYNFFLDLLRSINFFNEADRKEALFKLKKAEVLLVHHLKDWDFAFELVGAPLKEGDQERWDVKLGFYVKWVPIPLLQRRLTYTQKGDVWVTDMGR